MQRRRRRSIVTASPSAAALHLASSHWLPGANMLMTGTKCRTLLFPSPLLCGKHAFLPLLWQRPALYGGSVAGWLAGRLAGWVGWWVVGAPCFLKALGPKNVRTAQTELSLSHTQVHLEETQFAVVVLPGGLISCSKSDNDRSNID